MRLINVVTDTEIKREDAQELIDSLDNLILRASFPNKEQITISISLDWVQFHTGEEMMIVDMRNGKLSTVKDSLKGKTFI